MESEEAPSRFFLKTNAYRRYTKEVSLRFLSLAHPKAILYYLQIYTKETIKRDINWSPFLNACSIILALGLVLSLINSSLIFEKT